MVIFLWPLYLGVNWVRNRDVFKTDNDVDILGENEINYYCPENSDGTTLVIEGLEIGIMRNITILNSEGS